MYYERGEKKIDFQNYCKMNFEQWRSRRRLAPRYKFFAFFHQLRIIIENYVFQNLFSVILNLRCPSPGLKRYLPSKQLLNHYIDFNSYLSNRGRYHQRYLLVRSTLIVFARRQTRKKLMKKIMYNERGKKKKIDFQNYGKTNFEQWCSTRRLAPRYTNLCIFPSKCY